MIFIRLEGGLGNQLFQYAAGLSLSLKYNTNINLDISSLKNINKLVTKRKFELDNFNHEAKIVEIKYSKYFSYFSKTPAIAKLLTPLNIYKEKNNSFDENFLNCEDNTYLIGYFQSYKYFSNHSSIILKHFSPVISLSEKNKYIKNLIFTTSSVSIHIRRGDYVSNESANKFHGVLSLSYYKNAIAHIESTISNPHYFIFSDDPEWCRVNLPSVNENYTFIDHNSDDNAWQDLELMSFCKHHVIANSSFSWWGAWLADNKISLSNRIVIAPLNWFVKMDEINKIDRIPTHWLLIK